jgi:hypothetical protein
MPLKSIIDIDLSKVADLIKIMDRWQKIVERGPPAWKVINDRLAQAEKTMKRQVTVTHQLAIEAGKIPVALGSTVTKWAAIDRITLRVAGNVGSIAQSIFRIGAMTGVVGGLLGLGGLFGIDRMAYGAAAGRRSSLGLGLGYGAQQSFGANFGRLVDPESFLQAVAGAKFDVNQRVGLLGAGLTQQQLAGDTAQTAVALLQNLKRIADTTNPAMFGQVIQARRLGQFVSPEDLERLRNTSPQEFAQLLRGYQRNVGVNNVPPDVLKNWQDFTTQLTNAGNSIFNTFVRGLAPLAPGLTQLSGSVEKTIASFMASPALGEWIKKLDAGVEKFAGYIGTPDFQKNVESFVEGLSKLASTVWRFVSWFGGTGGGAHVGDRAKWAQLHHMGVKTAGELRAERAAGGATALGQLGRIFGIGGGTMTMDQLMGVVKQSERSGDQAVSPAGAIGRYQIMPGTAAMYGVNREQLFDPATNEAVARRYLAMLVKKYHGDTAKILAAYNAGPGREDQNLRAGPGHRSLPEETRRYVDRARGLDGYAPAVVTIENKAGADVNVSVNGLKN